MTICHCINTNTGKPLSMNCPICWVAEEKKWIVYEDKKGYWVKVKEEK